MNFSCSINTIVANCVDSETGKILQGGNFQAFNDNWKALNVDAQEISEYIALKAGLCAWQLQDGKRESKNTG